MLDLPANMQSGHALGLGVSLRVAFLRPKPSPRPRQGQGQSTPTLNTTASFAKMPAAARVGGRGAAGDAGVGGSASPSLASKLWGARDIDNRGMDVAASISPTSLARASAAAPGTEL